MEESEQQPLRSSHDVFVSYAVEDKPIADALVARLEANHIRCWFAPRDVLPGLSWASAIVDAINQSRLMVLVYSSQSNQSNQVRREVERAASRGIPILPFRIEDVPPSKDMEYFISSSHWLDALTPPLERHLQHLSETVSLLLARQVGPQVQELPEASNAAATAKPPTDAFIKKDRNRRVLMIVAGSAAVLAIVATSAVFAARGWKDGTGKTITSTPVPTAQAASLAPTPAPTPVPTSKAATNAIPTNPPGQLLYSDDFSDPSKGLFLNNQQGTGGASATTQGTWEYRYQDGALVGLAKSRYPIAVSAESGVKLFDDFAIEVRARVTKSPGQVQYGIHYGTPWNERWALLVKEPGRSYMVWSGKALRSVSGGQSIALNPLNEENMLRMEIRGDEMRVFINGREMDRVRDESLKKRGGAAGLEWSLVAQAATEDQVEIHFTDFKVYSLSSPSSPSIPTPTLTLPVISTPTPTPAPTPRPSPTSTPGAPANYLPIGRAGVTHVAGHYRFTNGNYLIEGASTAAALGIRSLALFFREVPWKSASDFRVHYPDNNDYLWPQNTPPSLAALAQTRPYSTVFGMTEFSTIVLTAYSPEFPSGAVFGAPSPTNYAAEEAEFYELTKYLLTAYRGFGKVFILTNWEADNMVFLAHSKPPFDWQQDESDADLQMLTAWLSARQNGVERARRELGDVPGVKVFNSIHIDRTLDVSKKNLKRVLNRVVPLVDADMVGCSCYDAMISNPEVISKASTKAAMQDALQTLDRWAPDPSHLGARRIYLQEYGLFENDRIAGRPVMSPVEAKWRTDAVLESVAEFGASYSFFWELYDNECKPPSGNSRAWPDLTDVPLLSPFETALGIGDSRRPTNNSCRGLSLIRPDGSQSPALEALRPYW